MTRKRGRPEHGSPILLHPPLPCAGPTDTTEATHGTAATRYRASHLRRLVTWPEDVRYELVDGVVQPDVLVVSRLPVQED